MYGSYVPGEGEGENNTASGSFNLQQLIQSSKGYEKRMDRMKHLTNKTGNLSAVRWNTGTKNKQNNLPVRFNAKTKSVAEKFQEDMKELDEDMKKELDEDLDSSFIEDPLNKITDTPVHKLSLPNQERKEQDSGSFMEEVHSLRNHDTKNKSRRADETDDSLIRMFEPLAVATSIRETTPDSGSFTADTGLNQDLSRSSKLDFLSDFPLTNPGLGSSMKSEPNLGSALKTGGYYSSALKEREFQGSALKGVGSAAERMRRMELFRPVRLGSRKNKENIPEFDLNETEDTKPSFDISQGNKSSLSKRMEALAGQDTTQPTTTNSRHQLELRENQEERKHHNSEPKQHNHFGNRPQVHQDQPRHQDRPQDILSQTSSGARSNLDHTNPNYRPVNKHRTPAQTPYAQDIRTSSQSSTTSYSQDISDGPSKTYEKTHERATVVERSRESSKAKEGHHFEIPAPRTNPAPSHTLHISRASQPLANTPLISRSAQALANTPQISRPAQALANTPQISRPAQPLTNTPQISRPSQPLAQTPHLSRSSTSLASRTPHQEPVGLSERTPRPAEKVATATPMSRTMSLPARDKDRTMPPPSMSISRAQSDTFLTVNGKRYKVMKLLGKGGSSRVYEAFDEQKNMVVAIKRVDLSSADEAQLEGYLNEINLLAKLQGEDRIVRLYDYEKDDNLDVLYVIMEKGDTDLASLLKEYMNQKQITAAMIKHYWTEMLHAVSVIHRCDIIHSDLKPANFLLVAGRLKLIDFGIASSVQCDSTSVLKDSQMGTFNFMSPEAIQDLSGPQYDGSGNRKPVIKISYKTDVWSLGCILYNLTYGKMPFGDIKIPVMKLQAILNPEHRIPFPADNVDPLLLDVIKSCLNRDMKCRPSIDSLLQHSYVTGCEVPRSLKKTQMDALQSLLGVLSPSTFEKTRRALQDPSAAKKLNL